MSANATSRGWPLLPLTPGIVASIGILIAVLISLIAARQLQHTSDEASALRSRALAGALAARMRSMGPEERDMFLSLAARRSGTELILVDKGGVVLSDHMLKPLSRARVQSLLRRAEGLSFTALGRVKFAASSVNPPLQHLAVLVFASAPQPVGQTFSMVRVIVILTLLLLGLAVGVAIASTRAAREDVAFVIEGISEMATPRTLDETMEPPRGTVPIRSFDQVGLLTASLNTLMGRFGEAESRYRRDLTRAADLDRERSRFLADLSHELRTPLNAILGFAHLLESDAEDPLDEDSLESVSVIRTSGEHLRCLVDDILDLSAMESGQLHLTRAVVDVRTLSDDVLREASAIVGERSIELQAHGAEGILAWADPRRLRQVLTNLVSNAIDATVQGVISISVSEDSATRHAIIVVRDSGRGIPPDSLGAIFEAYHQGGKPKPRGVGLGLAIARRLVLLHGGQIEVTSEVDEGTSFTIHLPDDSHAGSLPRDSLVPWSDSPNAAVDAASTITIGEKR